MLIFSFTSSAAPSLAFIDGLGGMEMLLIFVVVLLLFGGDKLPEFARGLGKTMREFKKAASGVEEEFKRAMEEDERKRSVPAIEPASTTPALTAAPEHTSGYFPEDGSTDYSSEAGPVAPAAATTDPASPDAGTDPTTGGATSAETAATDAATTKPVVGVGAPAVPPRPAHEDYP